MSWGFGSWILIKLILEDQMQVVHDLYNHARNQPSQLPMISTTMFLSNLTRLVPSPCRGFPATTQPSILELD